LALELQEWILSASGKRPIGSRDSGFGRCEPGRPEPDQGGGDDLPAAAAPVGCVSLEAEIPEELFDGMREFISAHPHWDQYRLISSALAGFLFQNGCTDSCVTQHYLNGLFMRSGPA
jgi:hypothetical protein